MTIAVLRVSAGRIAIIRTGENTAEAARQAGVATTKAAEAATFADTAENAAQAALGAANYYTTIAAGVAATAVGSMFTSDEGGTWNYYVRTAVSPFYALFRSVLAADANGNVGIGTTAPATKLTVQRSALAGNGVVANLNNPYTYGSGVGTAAATLQFTRDPNTGAAVVMAEIFGGNEVEDTSIYGYLAFGTRNGAPNVTAEHMRIDSAGNVGIGTSSPGVKLDVAGAVRVVSAVSGGAIRFAQDSNSLSRNWSLVNDYRAFGDICFVTAANHGESASVVRVQIATDGAILPGTDNTQNLGFSSVRWGTIFAGTGTINTSDEREKVWRGAMTDAEMRAAKRIIGELGMFQFIESVEEKGENARLHFGVRAQRAFAILEEEGLEWWRYAWCCYDQWDTLTEPVFEEVTVEKTRTITVPGEEVDAETGEPIMVEVEETYEEVEQRDTGEVRTVREAGDRYGIRADQLAYWLIAAQAEIQRDLEARISAIETKGISQ